MMRGPDVFVGVWQNYSKHLVLGSTITLKESQGDILQNVLALLVQSAGQSFWTIISYIIHQARNNRSPEHPLFYQQQGVLRNSGSALTAALRLGQLSVNWRERYGTTTNHYRFRSALYYIFVALVVSVGFSLASIFSSQITKLASHEVLLLPNDCGFWAYRDYAIPNNAKRALLIDAWSAMYANTCYKSDPDLLCGTYKVKSIKTTDADRFVQCPFPGKICLGPAKSKDTHLIDTAEILGVNARPSDRLQFRKVATCAPINLSKYVETYNKTFHAAGPSSENLTEEVRQYYLGARGGEGIRNENKNETKNQNKNLSKHRSTDLTYEYFKSNGATSPGYQLQAFHSEVGKSEQDEKKQRSDWAPITDFNRSDADTVVFILSTSGVAYSNNISDPFFSATMASKTGNVTFTGNKTDKHSAFRPKDPVSSIGCIDQYQICNPNLRDGQGKCTPLASAADMPNEASKLRLNRLQKATARILNHFLQESGIHNTVSSQGESALKAHATSYSLGRNVVQVGNERELKWENEFDYWFSASLASLQINFVQMVTDKSGPHYPPGIDKPRGNLPVGRERGRNDVQEAGGEGFISLNATASDKVICSSQMVHIMDGYQNFSLIGVILILVLSAMLIFVSLYIHVIGGKIQQIVFGNPLARVSWTSDGYLQLQRMAYEGAGYEGWQQCATDDVPLLRDVEKLGGLDISDINHPRLLRATDLLDRTKSPRAENPQNHQVPPLPEFNTLPPYTKELPLLPMLGVNLSNTVLDTRETHSAGQQRETEQDVRANDSTTIFTTFSGTTYVQHDRPLPPLPLRLHL